MAPWQACRSVPTSLSLDTKQRAFDFNRAALCFPAQDPSLLACINELNAIALVLEAIGEAEPLPSTILALIVARRQWCKGEVAYAANTRQTDKCLCARWRQSPDAALIST
jgi:hypothetical protein